MHFCVNSLNKPPQSQFSHKLGNESQTPKGTTCHKTTKGTRFARASHNSGPAGLLIRIPPAQGVIYRDVRHRDIY